MTNMSNPYRVATPTWRELVKIESRLAALYDRVCAVNDVRPRKSFCANGIWYGRADRSDFKDELVLLVGWEAQSRDPRIRTMEATAPHTTSSTPCPLIAVTAYAYDVRSMPQGRSSKVGGGVRVTSRRDFCSARPGASLRLAFLKHRSLTPIKPARWWFFFQVSNFEQASPNQGA